MVIEEQRPRRGAVVERDSTTGGRGAVVDERGAAVRERGVAVTERGVAIGERGLAPVAAVLLVAIVVVLAGGVAGATFQAATAGASADPPTFASLSLSAEGDRLTFTHRGGDRIDVSELEVRVRVDGRELAHQPPVPFFSAQGFRPGPTGPFNAASGNEWLPGESTSVTVAGTNEPKIRPGRTVEIRLAVNDRPIATLETTVRSG